MRKLSSEEVDGAYYKESSRVRPKRAMDSIRIYILHFDLAKFVILQH